MLTLINQYLKSKVDIQKKIFESILSLSQIVYNICKIRGFGPISKFFSSVGNSKPQTLQNVVSGSCSVPQAGQNILLFNVPLD